MKIFYATVVLCLMLLDHVNYVASSDPILLGCFKDQWYPLQDLTGNKSNNATQSPALCNAFCSGYKYFALTISTWCLCRDTYGTYVEAAASECDLPCGGDPNATCGADTKDGGKSYRVNIYSRSVEVISRGKPTSQSSTISGGNSSRAVDGNSNRVYGAGSCTHTGQDANAWWSVDLLQLYRVFTVKIWNRANEFGSRLSFLRISVLSPSMNGDQLEWRVCEDLGSITTNGGIYSPSCRGMLARNVSVSFHNKTDYLTLCEVEISGVLYESFRTCYSKSNANPQTDNFTTFPTCKATGPMTRCTTVPASSTTVNLTCNGLGAIFGCQQNFCNNQFISTSGPNSCYTCGSVNSSVCTNGLADDTTVSTASCKVCKTTFTNGGYVKECVAANDTDFCIPVNGSVSCCATNNCNFVPNPTTTTEALPSTSRAATVALSSTTLAAPLSTSRAATVALSSTTLAAPSSTSRVARVACSSAIPTPQCSTLMMQIVIILMSFGIHYLRFLN